MSLLVTLNIFHISSSVFFVEFEQIKVCWETVFYLVSIFSSNLFQANTPFLFPLKASENLWFSDVFRMNKK